MNAHFEICNAFNRQASLYERAAKVQQEIGMRMMSRLDYLKIEPKRILDLGCGPGYFIEQLSKRYPKAQVIGFDLAYAMLKMAKKRQRFWRPRGLVNGDMQALPFADGVFDMVFANQVIHWVSPLSVLLSEVSRVMAADACFMFTTLGPDTFKEIKSAWSHASSHAHTHDFWDMHDVGDALMAARFLDPVMDVEHLTVHYKSFNDLVRSLKDQGVRNTNVKRNPGLTSRQAWRSFEAAFASLVTDTGKYPLSYEVVYGQAWKGFVRETSVGTEVRIPVSNLQKRVL